MDRSVTKKCNVMQCNLLLCGVVCVLWYVWVVWCVTVKQTFLAPYFPFLPKTGNVQKCKGAISLFSKNHTILHYSAKFAIFHTFWAKLHYFTLFGQNHTTLHYSSLTRTQLKALKTQQLYKEQTKVF